MIEDERRRKKKKKVSVLFSLQTNEKLEILCDKMNRSKSGLIRLVTLEFLDRMLNKG